MKSEVYLTSVAFVGAGGADEDDDDDDDDDSGAGKATTKAQPTSAPPPPPPEVSVAEVSGNAAPQENANQRPISDEADQQYEILVSCHLSASFMLFIT